MYSRNQYLKVLRERYVKAKSKKAKTQILNGILLQHESGEEICHQKDTVRSGPEAEAEEEEERDL